VEKIQQTRQNRPGGEGGTARSSKQINVAGAAMRDAILPGRACVVIHRRHSLRRIRGAGPK
jgi:hypothetical protein